MKQIIYSVAVLLMAQNGKTSNLEVKNEARKQNASNPNFHLTQKDVSAFMTELADEHDWEVDYDTSGPHEFRVFSIKSDAGNSIGTIVASLPASSSTIGDLDESDGETVCYVSSNPKQFVQGRDRATARREVYARYRSLNPGMVWDDINTCTTKFFNKKYLPTI